MAEHGPIQSYEIQWRSGHTEVIAAHQVSYPGGFSSIFGGDNEPRRVDFHGEIDGHWRLVISLLESDVRTIRNVTSDERITPDPEAAS